MFWSVCMCGTNVCKCVCVRARVKEDVLFLRA